MAPFIKSNLPPSRVQSLLQERFGALSDFHPLAEGLSSQAFGFRVGARDYVVRVHPSQSGFDKDAFVQRTFGSAELPIPEVIATETLSDGVSLCISERAPGGRLHDLDRETMVHLAWPTSHMLETISTCDLTGTSGFGRFDAQGMAPFPTWRSFLTGIADLSDQTWRGAAQSIDLRFISTLGDQIAVLSERCPEERCLVHGDFGSFNVLSNGESITAVLDWDLALFGDPLYDWANLLFWNEAHMRPVLSCAGADQKGPYAQTRLLCYQLRIGLQELYDCARGTNPMDPEWIQERCRTILSSSL